MASSNTYNLQSRIIFIIVLLVAIVLLNLLLAQLSLKKSKALNYFRLGSLVASSFVLSTFYILISKPELANKFAMISFLLGIGYLFYMFKELKAISEQNGIGFMSFSTIPKIKILSISIALIYILYFSVLSVITYLTFESSTHDTAIFVNILHNLAQFKSAHFTIYDINFFEHHFSPFLYLLVPFYWLYSSPITLLVLQAVALGIGSVFLFNLANQYSKNEIFALFLQASYLLHPAVHGSNLFDFHEVSFLPLFLFGAFYYYEKGNTKLYWIFFVLALAIKEDVPIYTAMFGLYIGLIRGDKKTGIITLLLSVVYYLIIKQLLVHGVLYNRYNEMMIEGVDPEKGIILTILSNPVYAFDLIFANKQKVVFIIIMLLPLLYLPFRSGLALILLVPATIYGLLTNYEMHFNVNFHNSLPFIPALYYLTVLSTSRIKVNLSVIGSLIFISSVCVNAYFGSFSPALKPISEKFEKETKREIVNMAISKIPSNASVSAIMPIVTNLSGRDSIFTFGFLNYHNPAKYSITNEATYVVWDNRHSWWWPLASREQGFKFIQELAASGKYGLVHSFGGIYLLKKNHDTTKNHLLNRYYALSLPRDFAKEVEDKDSDVGYVLYAQPEDVNGHEKCFSWGPYFSLKAGKYKINFRFKTDNTKGQDEVASMEVIRHPGNYLGRKTIKASDFKADREYQIFTVPIEITSDLDNIECKIIFKGKRNLWVDYLLPERIE